MLDGIYEVEGELKGLSDVDRRAQRQRLAKPLWQELRQWLELARRLVADGAAMAKAIDYTLSHWTALTRHENAAALIPFGDQFEQHAGFGLLLEAE